MARTLGLHFPPTLRFSDTYDVYVDYGHGQPIKMNGNEAAVTDIEEFLIGKLKSSKLVNHKKLTRISATNLINDNKFTIWNSYKYDLTTNKERISRPKTLSYLSSRSYSQANTSSQTNYHYPSILASKHSCRDLSPSRMEPKLVYGGSWLSNKLCNTRVSVLVGHLDDTFTNKTKHRSNERKPVCDLTYHISPSQIIHEKLHPGINETNLCLRIAVNGASKSLRGELPLSNLNLNQGDFGDDAGMIVENRHFCFIGLADGAGGNRSLGINPADFSRAILSACQSILHQNNLKPNQLPRLIKSAMEQVEASKVQGSSTLCLLAFDKQDNTLTSLNIGDSGFVIYRNNKIYCRSTCTMDSNGGGPRQLFAINSSFALPCFINEKEILNDCSLNTIKVQKDDIIILSSDGLWDVIKSYQLRETVKHNSNRHLQNLANDLLKQAMDGYFGNSRDDILIIVCRVDQSES